VAKKESIQKRLQRIRPPRVQLTYDVEIGDAIELKELPFVVGVLGDFAAKTKVDQGKVRDRKFVNVDMDNFDDVMEALSPRTTYRVKNKMTPEGGEIGVDIEFKKFEDFRPESVVMQVSPLRKLQEARSKLADLRNKLAGNEKLEDLLQEVLNSTEQLQALGSEQQSGGEQ